MQVFALLLPLASWDAASTLIHPAGRDVGKDLVSRFFVAAAMFLFAFHLLGMVQLLTGWAVVRIDLAAILLVAVAIAARLLASRTRRRRARAGVLGWLSRHVRQHPFPALCVLVTHALLLASVFSAPPRGFDALWYHLPNMLRAHQSHTLDLQVGSYIEFYPANGDLFGLPLLALGNDSWVGLLQYPWFLIVALLTALLARRSGTPVGVAVATGLIVLTVPLLVYQAMRFYVDLIHAALSLGSLLYLIDWIRGKRATDLVLCGLTLSMLLGTKYIAVLPWLFVVAAIFAAAVGSRRGAGGRVDGWRAVALIIVVSSVFSWIWWVRNFAASGNPIAPIQVRFLVGTLLQGTSLGSVFGPPTSEPWSAVLRSLASSFGAALALVAAALAACVWWLRGRREKHAGVIGIELAYVGWGVFSFFVLLTQDPRFLIAPFLVSIALASAWLARFHHVASGLLLATALVNTALVVHRIALADDFDVSLISSSRNRFYGLPDEIDRLPAGARLLLRGHPALVYPAAGAMRQSIVYPSPMGPVQDEIERWRIDYVFVRTSEPAEIVALQKLASLRLLRSSRLRRHLWWDHWPDRRPRFTALFRVVDAEVSLDSMAPTGENTAPADSVNRGA